MTPFICRTCGVQHAPSAEPPKQCVICEDERQYVGRDGQQWVRLEELSAERMTDVVEIEPDLYGIETKPSFAIGQRGHLIRTPAGNLMWESVSTISHEAVAKLKELGGVQAIAISHPHFYSSSVEWSRALDDPPIWLNRADKQWVMRPDDAIRLWGPEAANPLPGSGLTLINTGGHFPGMTACLWPRGAEGRGALLCGDIPQVVQDKGWVSWMYSYPNLIPLPGDEVQRIAKLLGGYQFDRIYGSWRDRVIAAGGKDAIRRSAERYVKALSQVGPSA